MKLQLTNTTVFHVRENGLTKVFQIIGIKKLYTFYLKWLSDFFSACILAEDCDPRHFKIKFKATVHKMFLFKLRVVFCTPECGGNSMFKEHISVPAKFIAKEEAVCKQ